MSTSYPIQVVVGLRQSKVNPKVISRASFDRVIDPLKFLQNQGLVQIQYATTLNELKKLRNTEIRQVLFFNGAFSEADLVFFKNAKEVGYIAIDIVDHLQLWAMGAAEENTAHSHKRLDIAGVFHAADLFGNAFGQSPFPAKIGRHRACRANRQ